MKKLIMMYGLPGSGKSTWAKEHIKINENVIRINNDDLQLMLFNEVFSKDKYHLLDNLRDDMIKHFMKKGVNVIIDNTNLHPKHRTNYERLVKEINESALEDYSGYLYEFVIKSFADVNVVECLRRNKLRSNPVPDKVIYDMYNSFLKPEPTKYIHDDSLQKAIIVDIDGTVAQMVDRSPHDKTKYHTDAPINEVIEVIKALAGQTGAHIVFLTGRDGFGTGRKDTYDWIQKHLNLANFTLLMRTQDDGTPDYIFKEQVFNTNVLGKFNVIAWFEDRWRNVEMARTKLGIIPVFQIGDGNF